MRFESRTFWLPKDLDFPRDYMDACALEPRRGVAAIADGVASAVFSGAWARLVTQAVLEAPPNLEDGAAFVAWLAGLRAQWRGQIEPLVAAMQPNERWRIKPKLVDGAMTTLLWLELAPEAEAPAEEPLAYRLRGYSIGDCALVHLRGDELLYTFPMQDSAFFAENPQALGSVDRKLDHLLEFIPLEVTCLPGDLLVLCTDAVGLWAMRRWESGEPVRWEDYWDRPEEAWREEVLALRGADPQHGMRVDDTTLVLLRVLDERIAAIAPEPQPEAPQRVAAAVPLEETAAEVAAATAPEQAPAGELTAVEASGGAEVVEPAPCRSGCPTVATDGEATAAVGPDAEPTPATSSASHSDRHEHLG